MGEVDSRLLSPGSVNKPSPVAAEKQKSQEEVKSLDAKIKHAQDLGEAFENRPEAAASQLRQATQSVRGALSRDRTRSRHIASVAREVEKLYRGITESQGLRVRAEIQHDNRIAAEYTGRIQSRSQDEEHHDLGESADLSDTGAKGSNGMVWSATKAKYVPKAELKQMQVEAKAELHKLQAKTSPMRPTNIRKKAMRHVMKKEISDTMKEALAAEKADESQIRVAQRRDDAFQLQGYTSLQRNKIKALRSSELGEAETLTSASTLMKKLSHSVQSSIEEEAILKAHASTMAMKSMNVENTDLGQSMEGSSMDRKFGRHVAEAMESKVQEGTNSHLTADERGRMIATLWDEGHKMLSKEIELAEQTRHYHLKKMEYVARKKLDHGSPVEAFNVETNKWYAGRILGRDRHRLNVHYKKLGINEWLPDTSKRLRIPKEALESHTDPENRELGASESVGESDSEELNGTMSESEADMISNGIGREQHIQKAVQRLAQKIDGDTKSLRKMILQHIKHPTEHVAVKPVGEESFDPALENFQQGRTPNSMSDLGIVDHYQDNLSATTVYDELPSEDHKDLGESGLPTAMITEQGLASHDHDTMLAYEAHTKKVEHQTAQAELWKMSMEDIKKAAVEQQVLAAARVTRLAKKTGADQVLVAQALKRLDAKKRHQLKIVQAAARAGVWSSVQSSLAHETAKVHADAQNVDINLKQEEAFKAKVVDRASLLAREAGEVHRLETSSLAVEESLGEGAAGH